MKLTIKCLNCQAALALSFLFFPSVAKAQHYQQTNLVSDIPGMAPVTDPNLKNPWGLTRSSTSPWWVANNNSGTSTLYTGAGQIVPINGSGTVLVPPPGFAPNAGGTLFVTYAKQDAARHDPVGGDGLGFVELFTPSGKHVGQLQHGDWFNAPWGVVWTTRDFGEFSNAIVVGNFRSGWAAAFNGFTHKFIGFLRNADNSLVTIDGLWSLTFGNGAAAGSPNSLFFTAGIKQRK